MATKSKTVKAAEKPIPKRKKQKGKKSTKRKSNASK